MKHQGSCLCGGVKFEVDGDFESFYLCHCQHCQKDTGSAHGANLFSTTATLKWNLGQSQVTTYTLPKTRHTKAFCQSCGSALPAIELEGKLVKVPAGSLDTEISIKPNAHIFCASRAKWEDSLIEAVKFDQLPTH